MYAKDLYERLAAGYDYDPMYGELCNQRDRLKIENMKLRELVKDLARLPAVPCFDCFGCKYEKHHDCESGFKCMLIERAKELGIEV